MYAIVALLAAAIVGRTIAVAPCDDKIIATLSSVRTCYQGGKAPVQTAQPHVGTHIRITKGAIPANTKCVAAYASNGEAYVKLFGKNGRKDKPYSVKQEVKNGYILETDPTGKIYPKNAKYRLYVIHNKDNVYSYYRCTEGSTGSTGTTMVDIAVDCKHTKDLASKAMVNTAMQCFKALGVPNKDIEHFPPCKCSNFNFNDVNH